MAGGGNANAHGGCDDKHLLSQRTTPLLWADKPAEQTPVVVLRFSHTASPRVIKFVKEQLQSHNIIVLAEESKKLPITACTSPSDLSPSRSRSASGTDTTNANNKTQPSQHNEQIGSDFGTTCLAITTTRSALEEEAESQIFMKLTKEGSLRRFSVAERDEFAGIDRHSFFNLAERAMLVMERLDFIRVVGKGTDANVSQTLDELGISYASGGEATLRNVLEANELLDAAMPLHDPTQRDRLMWSSMKFRLPGSRSFKKLENKIVEYYGSEVC